jgi:hypothetical protein
MVINACIRVHPCPSVVENVFVWFPPCQLQRDKRVFCGLTPPHTIGLNFHPACAMLSESYEAK